MSVPTSWTADRHSQLADGLARVRRRIAVACRDSGRPPSEVTLVVVTKFFPATDVAGLVTLGVRDIGESRDQEASAKLADLAGLLRGGPRPTVHFIGQVQTKKAGSVAAYADVVHSVDRLRLVEALNRGAVAHGRTLDVLVQLALDLVPPLDLVPGAFDEVERPLARPGAGGRGGVDPAELAMLADAVEASPGLTLRGIMAVAPAPPVEPGAAFARLQALHAGLLIRHPSATWLSAGMSSDLEAAIAHGATHVRVGSAILGPRRP